MPIPPDCLPTEGYLAARVSYGRENGIACDSFHLAAGLIELAAALGKQVWIQSHGERLYLNLSCCLVGPTACGKSQTLRMTRRILGRLEKVHVLSGSYSTEGLEKILTRLGEPERETPEAPDGRPAGAGGPDCLPIPLPWQEAPDQARRLAQAHQGAALLTFDELARLLESRAKHYNVDLPTTVGTLLDSGASIDRILVKTRKRAEDLCVSGFALTQPAYFFGHLRPDDLLRGPVTRFCLLPDEGRQPRYGYNRGREEKSINLLAKELHRRTAAEGELDLPMIQPDTAAFERRLHEELTPALTEEEAALLDARLPVRALQLTALIHLAERDDLIIRPEDYARAVRLLLHWRELALALKRQHYAPTWEGRLANRLLAHITKEPGYLHRQLCKRFHLYDPRSLHVLEGLAKAKLIERRGKGVRGDPETWWPLPLTEEGP